MDPKHQRVLSRRTVVSTAWTIPVAAYVATAPMSAASPNSGPQLGVQTGGPVDSDGFTSYTFRITNTGTTIIPAGALTATVPTDGPDYYLAGFSSSNDAPWARDDAPSPETSRFVHQGAINPDPDTTSGVLFLFFDNTGTSGPTTPSVEVTFAAPGFANTPVTLSIPY